MLRVYASHDSAVSRPSALGSVLSDFLPRKPRKPHSRARKAIGERKPNRLFNRKTTPPPATDLSTFRHEPGIAAFICDQLTLTKSSNRSRRHLRIVRQLQNPASADARGRASLPCRVQLVGSRVPRDRKAEVCNDLNRKRIRSFRLGQTRFSITVAVALNFFDKAKHDD